MIKHYLFSIAVIFLFLITVGCNNGEKSVEKNKVEIKKNEIKKNEIKKVKVGLALGYAGIGDKGFNDMQYKGLIEASKKYDIDICYAISANDTEKDLTDNLEKLVLQKCDLIITAGFLMIKPINTVSAKYKNTMFVVLDNNEAEKRPNVISVLFAQHEGAFVVGALAALISQTHKIGFIGGVEIPVVNSFKVGFEEGVRYIDKNANIEVKYCSTLPDFSGFTTPEKGYKTAEKMYQKNIDIIFSVAGATGIGIIKAADDNKKWVIGVDSNQDYLAKGYVLTSMMKRFDFSVIDIVDKYINKHLVGNTSIIYGYNNGGIGLTPMEYTREKISDETYNKIKTIENKIKTGEIKVTNTLY